MAVVCTLQLLHKKGNICSTGVLYFRLVAITGRNAVGALYQVLYAGLGRRVCTGGKQWKNA